MNTKRYLTFFIACAFCTACTQPCVINWTEGETDPGSGRAIHTLTIENPPAGTDWTIWFSQFRTPVTMAPDAPGSIDHISGTLYRVVPGRHRGKTMTLRYEARPLVNQCRAPEGFHLQCRGSEPVAVEATYNFLPATNVHSFDYQPVQTNPYDMIPRLKRVQPRRGETDPSEEPTVRFVKGQAPGWYRLTLDGSLHIEAADEDGAYYASVTLDNIRRSAKGAPVGNATVTDWPDLPYRGLMLDVSRNFTKKDDLLRLLDIAAHYKVNFLHLHFGDDEGWRIQIDALPELTEYGAYRCLPELQTDGTILEPNGLQPTYCIASNRDSESPGSGYYTHEDFVEILRYAWVRHIRIVPEFDTPGHARAEVKSMEVRAARTGDINCLLSEPEDTSEYESVQDYTDNVINVALPSTYTFFETVFDALIAMYREAGVPLEAIHVGGDEVPEGAWTGSPACRALMEAHGKTDIGWLKDYFTNRLLDIAEARGIKLAGWQDVAQELEPATLERLKRNLAFTNLWTVSDGRDVLPYQFANDGIPVIISSAPNCYMDFAYNSGKLERGHSWGGFVDERRSFSLQPYDMYRSVRWDDDGKIVDLSRSGEGKPVLKPAARRLILGVEGHLWAETLRCFDHVTYYLFPKALGLFERGWNATPVWAGTTAADDPAFTADFDRFFSIIVDHEYPYYESQGISYHRHQ
ncbi:MAG: family 20 glycosylhydrolase [Bacteroidales bacterium]|nr:family 20 glycosylhydrolase [Bacteroidales bacterium]